MSTTPNVHLAVIVACAIAVFGCGGDESARSTDDAATGDSIPTDTTDAPDAQEDADGSADVPDAARDAPEDARADGDDASLDARTDAGGADSSDSDGDGTDDADPPGHSLVAVKFNTGSGANPPSREPNFGYGPAQKATSDAWYGNGLAWSAFVEQTRTFFADVRPDVVAFQEIFWPGECEGIPSEARTGFVCEALDTGEALPETVVELVLGAGYQVMCNPGNPDKCAAVRREFGSFRGCDDDLCLEGMDGRRITGCGGGARVAGATIDLDSGGELRLVNVHGTSGFTADDAACRVRQLDAIFVGADGAPALVEGPANLVMGDFNTDPGRLTASDPSARRWLELTSDTSGFHFVTEMGPDAPPTYALFNIDHVVASGLSGVCEHPRAISGVYFDHRPVVCSLRAE